MEVSTNVTNGMRLRDQMKGLIPENERGYLSNRFHIIGDIAIVRIPPEVDDYKDEIARSIISNHRNIKTVLNKLSKLEGEERVASFEILAGSKTVTLHREFGFAYRMDVSRVFFNSHLGFERERIAQMAGVGEKALVAFCGVGPYAIPIAAKGADVLALDKSTEACRWLLENARLNRVEEKINIINGDAFSFAHLLSSKEIKFDRIIIPTPYGMDHILDEMAPLVKDGGMIHFYTFKKQHEIEGLIDKYEEMHFDIKFYRRCGNVAPGVSRWVFDLVGGGKRAMSANSRV